jgi:hypothetical protein
MALKIIDHGTPEYKQMVKLREDILRHPLGLTFLPEELEQEKNNLLMAADTGLLHAGRRGTANRTPSADGCIERPSGKRYWQGFDEFC